MINKVFMLCMMAAIAIVSPLYAQDIVKVKQLTTEAESQIANEQWDEAIATLNTIRNIMGSLEGKPKELYTKAQEGKRRQEEEVRNQENKIEFNRLVQEGDDLYDLGYYQKALDKYLEAQDLFNTAQLTEKIERTSKLVSESLADFYDKKAREYESEGYISTALDYYQKAQDAKFSESREKRIKEIKSKLNGYYKNIENGNQAYLNKEYHAALGYFLTASKAFTSEDMRSMLPQSTFMVRIHEFDSLLAKNNIKQASRIVDTLEFLNTKFKADFRDPADMQCFLYAAQKYLGNAKTLKYLDALAQEPDIKALDVISTELDSVDGNSEYGVSCKESSENEIWSQFRAANALKNSRISKVDLDEFLWNYYVKSYFGKSKKEISNAHLASLHYVLKAGAFMYSYKSSVEDFWYYDIEATDDFYPGVYEVQLIKKGTIDAHWDSTLFVFNIGVKQLMDKGLYDSAQSQLKKLFDYVYFFDGDTSIAYLINNYPYSWGLDSRFPKYEYVKYMFKHPSFKESYQLYLKLTRLIRNQQSKWEFSLTVPAALGRVNVADRAIYDYNYTTNLAPYSFRESSAADRNIEYKGPTKLFQTQLSYRSQIGKGPKALQIEWQADLLYLLGKDGTSKWKTYTPKSVGTNVPFYGQIQSAQSLTGNRNGYQMIVTGLNPSIRVYKWVHLVLGLNYLNLNYNNNFSVPKNESPSNFTLKQTKPVLGFSLDFPGLYKQKWGVHVNYMNYSALFNSSTNLIEELPADAQRSGGLVTLKPMAFQLKTGIQGDFSDWSLKLDYQVFRSHVNYANVNPQLYMYRFRGMSWNLLSVSLLKSL